MKQASKETVDNLIINASKTIEDLYSKVKADNNQLTGNPPCERKVVSI